MADPVAWYDANAETVSARYEETAAEDIQRLAIGSTSGDFLDVGAGVSLRFWRHADPATSLERDAAL
jgi:hypothetical protein